MNRTCKHSDKENEESNSNLTINPKIKWALLKRNQEMPKNVTYNLRTAFKKHKRSDSCPIVDEVCKKVNHVSKKEKSHLGEKAFMPISL